MQHHGAIVLFLKAALPPGARWITVHPNGKDEPGHPVLIQPSADGAYRVIGGAGGKLNYLKLTGVKSEGEYKAEAAKRATARRERDRMRAAEDKKAGISEAKGRAREAVKAVVKHHEAKFIETVGQALGWKPEDMRFPEEKFQNASEAAIKKAAQDHARELFRRAQEAVDTQRKRLVDDAEARAEAGLAEVPLTTSAPERLSVEDLDPAPTAGAGLGFSPDYGGRAEAAGLTKEELATEAEATRPEDKRRTPEQRDAAKAERQEKSAAIQRELAGIREAGPKVDPRQTVEAKKAVELMKAKKALDEARKQARVQLKQIDRAKEASEVEAKGTFVIELGKAPVEDAAQRQIMDDLRTARTRGFLEQYDKLGGGNAVLGKHLAVGAYNSLNSLALAASGAALMDRSVVDVLGPGGAAQVLARRLATDLTPEEFEQTREAVERFHVSHYMELSQDALREAREWQEMANEIEIGEASTTQDLAVAQELNAKRRTFTQNAQRTIATALGEMETNAALVAAMAKPKRDTLEVSLGGTSVEDAIRQARAIGLERGDYQVEKIGATTFLTITGAGQDRLAQPIAREDLERVRGSLDIIEGRQDEAGWLPAGVANRPDLAMKIDPGVAPRIAEPFPNAPQDVGQAVRDFIGGRMADGDDPASIVKDLLAEDVIQRAGDRDAFMAAVNEVAPLYDGKGQMIRAEAHAEAFERLADEFLARRGGERTGLHRQNVPVDQVTVDALHRALMKHPEGTAAFKAIGELTPQDQGALRAAFAAEHGRTDPKADALRQKVQELDAAEPEKETEGLFGMAQNPEWASWKQERDAAAEAANKATMTWSKYVDVMGSPTRAYEAMQDVVRSRVLREFADAHNRLRPDSPLKIGRTAIANDLHHLDALDPDARERRLADQRQLVDRLRTRVAGRYAAGGVADKLDAAREAEAAAQQAQMGLFGAVEEPPAVKGAPEPEKPLELGQRWTLGHAAERTIAGMMPEVGSQFRAGRPVKLWQATMSGRYIARQRAVKLIRHNKRTMLGMGTGSGKTSIMLAGFTDAHAAGEAKKGLFLVPSVVQGQFHGEALTLLQPGKYRWHADPSASREERIAAYRDPDTHFSVVTHQAFRDDMLHLAAKRESTTPAAVAKKLDAMQPSERATYMRGLMEAEGIATDYLAVDEGHNLLNRAGKQNSSLANVVDAVSTNSPYYVSSTADPVKNDASEAFDVLAKMDPQRYRDRDAFMRRYGVDTAAAKDGLRREMARHFYTAKIDPGVAAKRQAIEVPLSPEDHEHLKRVDDAAARARLARMKGQVDVEAMQSLSPGSFKDVPAERHEEVARKLQRSIGIVHQTAVQHGLNGKAKLDHLAGLARDRKGKPGVVFAHNLDRVAEIKARLEQDGHRVVTLTGGDSTAEKDRKKAEFQAGGHDIMILSDAGAVGANLQRGKWLVQYDTPLTAMTHAQRGARIHRVGQTEDVELMDLVAQHPAERRNRDRLARKYELREVMTSPLEGLDDSGIAGMLQRVRAGDEASRVPVFQQASPEDQQGLATDDQQDIFSLGPDTSPPGLAGSQ